MKETLQSSKVRAILWIVGAIVAFLLVFGLGAVVGYHEASFAGRFGENYYQNFFGGFPAGRMANTHGAAGEVIDVSSSSISVRDADGDEESVLVASDTVIREMNNTITVSEVQVGNGVTVIGTPNANGQIEARFVRVFDTSSSLPTPPSPMPPGGPVQ